MRVALGERTAVYRPPPPSHVHLLLNMSQWINVPQFLGMDNAGIEYKFVA